jgi:hypothetical protein
MLKVTLFVPPETPMEEIEGTGLPRKYGPLNTQLSSGAADDQSSVTVKAAPAAPPALQTCSVKVMSVEDTFNVWPALSEIDILGCCSVAVGVNVSVTVAVNAGPFVFVAVTLGVAAGGVLVALKAGVEVTIGVKVTVGVIMPANTGAVVFPVLSYA